MTETGSQFAGKFVLLTIVNPIQIILFSRLPLKVIDCNSNDCITPI